jgi:hypothetical protein
MMIIPTAAAAANAIVTTFASAATDATAKGYHTR